MSLSVTPDSLRTPASRNRAVARAVDARFARREFLKPMTF